MEYEVSDMFKDALIFSITFSFLFFIVSVSRTLFGVILGATSFLVVLSLETAIYWGQYGDCIVAVPTQAPTRLPGVVRKLEQDISTVFHEPLYHRLLRFNTDVECYHVHAMKSVCAFSVFMFLSYVVLIGLLLKYQHDILGTAPLDEGLGNYSPLPTSPPPIPPALYDHSSSSSVPYGDASTGTPA